MIIVSRAILYIIYKYSINHTKIIDYKNLLLWNIKFPPLNGEIYHNKIVLQIQKSNNVFISEYDYMLRLCSNNII